MGRLDHVHIRVPDREAAARWYAEHLGFEPVERFDFWAKGFEGGPLQISADGGQTMLALFEASEGHPMIPQKTGVAFSLDADGFIALARSLPCGIDSPSGRPLEIGDIVDFDMCWAFNLADPWGNQYELNCYDYDRIATDLIEADGVEPVRYWPRELYAAYRDRREHLEAVTTEMSEPIPKFYHGARVDLRRGNEIPPRDGVVYFTPDLDAAIWAAELSEGDGEPRVYRVAVTGSIENAVQQPDYTPPPHPAMSWRSREPLMVLDEVTEWTHYHGTRADLRPGDLIEPGHAANFGATPRSANHVYFARTLDAAIWGAELAAGEGPGRIYIVEPTGEIESDPNLTNMRFRGNPTKSFRSRAPLRVTGELEEWAGHPPEAIRAMKEGLARLEQQSVEPSDE
jgi:catechol 2,3-dioxygenase-like lactoylglutathione lyase family enzyme